jgi:type IV pilus biogenesis protein PilP
MNRNHYQKMLSSAKAGAALLVASGIFSVAVAQELPPLDQQTPTPGGIQLPAAEPEFVLPEGATVGNIDEKLKKLSGDASKKLRELQGDAVNNEREKNDIEARSTDLREIQSLEMDLQKAKVLKELYKTVNAEEDQTKQELETVKSERDELSVQVKTLEEQLITVSKQVSASARSAEPNPVIVTIFGAGNNLSARLLVPYYGETIVKQGDVLANGQTVSSISSNGVSVSQNGNTARLSFGTTVPATPRR